MVVQGGSMKVQIHTFADIREAAGEVMELEVEDGTRAGELMGRLKHEFPELEQRLSYCRFAINRTMATDETPIRSGDEIFLFPPPSGG